jgi:hypothetical protein
MAVNCQAELVAAAASAAFGTTVIAVAHVVDLRWARQKTCLVGSATIWTSNSWNRSKMLCRESIELDFPGSDLGAVGYTILASACIADISERLLARVCCFFNVDMCFICRAMPGYRDVTCTGLTDCKELLPCGRPSAFRALYSPSEREPRRDTPTLMRFGDISVTSVLETVQPSPRSPATSHTHMMLARSFWLLATIAFLASARSGEPILADSPSDC